MKACGFSHAGIGAGEIAAGKNFPGRFGIKLEPNAFLRRNTPVEAGHDRFSSDLMDYAHASVS